MVAHHPPLQSNLHGEPAPRRGRRFQQNWGMVAAPASNSCNIPPCAGVVTMEKLAGVRPLEQLRAAVPTFGHDGASFLEAWLQLASVVLLIEAPSLASHSTRPRGRKTRTWTTMAATVQAAVATELHLPVAVRGLRVERAQKHERDEHHGAPPSSRNGCNSPRPRARREEEV